MSTQRTNDSKATQRGVFNPLNTACTLRFRQVISTMTFIQLLRRCVAFRITAIPALALSLLSLVPATALAVIDVSQPHPYNHVPDQISTAKASQTSVSVTAKNPTKHVTTKHSSTKKAVATKNAVAKKVVTRKHHTKIIAHKPSSAYKAAAHHRAAKRTAKSPESAMLNVAPAYASRNVDPHNVVKALNEAEIAAVSRRHEPIQVQSALALPLDIESRAALITNANTGEVLYGKNATQSMPIASITKLMTAMVVLDAGLSLNDPIAVSDNDVDHLRHTSSRLSVGSILPRGQMLLIALMASENRAASALANTYPGGISAAVAAMNRKAQSLGMTHTIFHDPTGLNGENMSTPADLVKMVQAANRYPDIRRSTTTSEYQVVSRGRVLNYKNTNALVKKPEWNIEVSKTGFINEAGRCLVMMAHVNGTPVVIVLMDSVGKYTRIGDANRVKRWLELALRS